MSLLRPIQVRQDIACPACDQVLASMFPDRVESQPAEPWLLDGDTVPGVRNGLGDQPLGPDAFETMLTAGRCPACGHGLYVVEVTFVTGTEEDLLSWWACEHQPSETQMYAWSSPGHREWSVERTLTGSLTVMSHMAGPFACTLRDLDGPNGVSSSLARAAEWGAARDLVLAEWACMQVVNGLLRTNSARDLDA